MESSRLSNSGTRLTPSLLFAASVAMLLATPVWAADPRPSGNGVGPPTPLFTPSPPSAGSSTAATPTTHAAVASPGKHQAAPAQRIPLDAKALIPPAAVTVPAKLGAVPEPRPALSLETDLEPLGPGPAPASGTPPAGKSPSS